jgi:hypothetical protein
VCGIVGGTEFCGAGVVEVVEGFFVFGSPEDFGFGGDMLGAEG